MKITKEEYKTLSDKISGLERVLNGGKGSGTWGHKGRPGEIGGSGKGEVDHEPEGDGIKTSDGDKTYSKKDFGEAKAKFSEQSAKQIMVVDSKGNKTYRVEHPNTDKIVFNTEREAIRAIDGMTYAGHNATSFNRVEVKQNKKDNVFESYYAGSDVGVGQKSAFYNEIDAKAWATGYNEALKGIEKLIKKNK